MASDQIRETLSNEEARLTALRDDVRSEGELDLDEQQVSGGELSIVDQHPADVATEVQSREENLAFIEQVEAELTDVERALAKLNDGSYGKCEACGKRIEAERLTALPATRFCLADATADQTSGGVSAQSSIDVGSNSQAPI